MQNKAAEESKPNLSHYQIDEETGAGISSGLFTNMPEAARLKVIAAIPAFNTAFHISSIVSQATKYVSHVFVVDDGSSDNTANLAGSAGATVVSHELNRGYGEAIKSCFDTAIRSDADVLVILDGDGQHNPDNIPAVLNPIVQDGADIVIGSRFLKYDRDIPRYRRFGISVITFLLNIFSKVKVTDAQSGFRAYSKNMMRILPLSESGMSISIEILEKARRLKAVIKEVPISCHYGSAPLNVKTTKHGLSVALSVVRIRLKSMLKDTRG